ncbi:MAG TPA: 4-hydroxy-tetrahydrodipicolinate synthase [Chitinophagaceae bacterium]|nr:MAG: dihydrodipicolinate synthase [Bacteroidetes bacterium OLB11]HMN32114.1 4-hydroxy-tetrahydrodipicolinate synthase [Chitinophagaceae bacterium]
MNVNQYKGTGVALVTPFNENGDIDYKALEKLTNHVIEQGVQFLVALGTTAETPTLSDDEKNAVLNIIQGVNNGRVPLVCGIGGNNTNDILKKFQNTSLDKVDAILSVAPYYNKPTQAGMIAHFETLNAHTPKPIILYNVPGRTGSNMTAQTTIHLANHCKNIIGIKEASGNMVQCMEIVKYAPENFRILSGDDNLILAQVACGFHGVISVAANCFPAPFSKMVNLALASQFTEARTLHYQLLEGIDLLFAEGNPAGVKCVLAEMGMMQNQFRLPIVPVSEQTHLKIQQFLKTL